MILSDYNLRFKGATNKPKGDIIVELLILRKTKLNGTWNL